MILNNRQTWLISDLDSVVAMDRELLIRNLELPARSAVNPHTHEWGQLIYSAKGVLWVETSDQSYVIPPLYALWVPQGERHSTAVPDGASFRSLYISGSLAVGFDDKCRVISVSPLLRELVAKFSSFPMDYEENGAQGRLVQALIDELLMAEAADLYLPIPEKQGVVRVVVETLIESPGDQRSLEDWADQLHVSARTLARHFQKETGMGFRDWRQKMRVLTSIQRLEAGDAVTTVALELGYDTPSAFSVIFKRVLGKTPTEYIERVR